MSKNPAPASTQQPKGGQDASRRDILLYAVGNVESGIADKFYDILNTVSIVVLGMNPMVMGVILSIKTVWDAITDPIMAQITDSAHTRWGRRIPFILTGGLLRVLFVLAVFLFFPVDSSIKSNAELQREKEAKTAMKTEAASSNAASVPAAEANAGDSAGPVEDQKVPAAPAGNKEASKGGFMEGVRLIFTDTNSYHHRVAIYLFIACLLFALLSTMHSVPYYALGIELCPSYDGRTRLVTYRAFVSKAVSLVGPWILPFIFLPIFSNALVGLKWYGVVVCVVGIPTTILMCMKIKERPYDVGHKRPPAPPLFRAIWLTAKNPHFLKILFLYVFIGFTNGIFASIGTFLVLYWVFSGDILQGSVVQGYAAMIATGLGFISLPAINWASKKFGKHRTLQVAILWLSVGTALKWVLWNPTYPYLMLILPLFHSIGISTVYTILPSLMADVTDIDELNNGVRREGMFGAVMSFLSKAIGSVTPIVAAGILRASGFQAPLGADQLPGVFMNMRIMASLIPAVLLLLALAVLFRYPLTRKRMEEVKAILARRAEERAAQAGPAH